MAIHKCEVGIQTQNCHVVNPESGLRVGTQEFGFEIHHPNY